MTFLKPTLRVTCLFLLINIVLTFNRSVLAQMRQTYLDTVAGNEIHKLSFYNPNEGYAAFNDRIGYTNDSGRTFTKKYMRSQIGSIIMWSI